MRLTKVLLLLVFFSGSHQALACNWVNPNIGVSKYLECRSNWRGFLLDTESSKRVSQIAASYVRGEMEKLSALGYVPRQVLTIDEGDLLHANFKKVDKLLDSVNHRIRRDSAMQAQGDLVENGLDTVKNLLPVGLFAGISLAYDKFPVVDAVLKRAGLKSGGSGLVSVIVLPMKVELIQDIETGQIFDMDTHQVSDKDGNNIIYSASSFAKSSVKDTSPITVDFRTTFLLSKDLKINASGPTKTTGAQFNLGLIWANQIVSTHQLMGYGWALGAPARSAKQLTTHLNKIPGLKNLIPGASFLLAGAGLDKLGVDSIKFGSTSFSTLNPLDDEIDSTGIVTFHPSRWLWFRWNLVKSQKKKQLEAVEQWTPGNYRANGFVVAALESDGETQSQLNGVELVGDENKSSLVGTALSSAYNGVFSMVKVAPSTMEDQEDKEDLEQE